MTAIFQNHHSTAVALPRVGKLEHPHLLCDMRDIEALRKRIGQGRPRALWNRLVANCRTYLDPLSEHSVDRHIAPDDTRSQTRTQLRNCIIAAGQLAFADLIEGGSARGEAAARTLTRLLCPGNAQRSAILTVMAPPKPSTNADRPFGGPYHRDLPRNNLDMHLAILYDFAEPFMDDDQRRATRAYLHERVRLAWDHRWRQPLGTNNRPPRFHMDPAAEAMALWGDIDDPILAEFPAYAAPIVEDYLDSAFYSDGASVEGMIYGACLCHVLNFADMLARKDINHGILNPRPMFRNLILFYYLTRDPDDVMFTIAKCTPSRYPGYHMWLQIARSFDAPLARWWWRRRFDATCEAPDLAGYEAQNEYRQTLAASMLLCNDDDPDQSPQELKLPASHRFFRRGLVVMRKDHEEDTPVFRLVAGPLVRYGTAQHWDAMSITLSAYGQRLIVDSGKSGKTDMDTAAHCSLLINGKGQETLCANWPRSTLFEAEQDAEQDRYKACIRSQPALIQWHERSGDLEYVMATAMHSRSGVFADGYGDCRVAERHVLAVHEGVTPFFVVTCDIFDYPEDVAAHKPTLQFVLIAAADTTLTTDESGATISGPNASLRAHLVTADNVNADQNVHNAHPRLIWKRKGEHGRIMTVLTPYRRGMQVPTVECVADDESRTACIVRFGDHEDHVTFFAPREVFEAEQPYAPKTGMRLKVSRRRAAKEHDAFTIPTRPGSYVVE